MTRPAARAASEKQRSGISIHLHEKKLMEDQRNNKARE